MKIYTKTGDEGQTSLLTGGRVAKNHIRIEAYGTVDELNSLIGLSRSRWPASPQDGELHLIQADLFDVGAQLAASSPHPSFLGVDVGRIASLERQIDAMEAELSPLTTFILPGGSEAAAHLHVARAVCRRAERLAVGLEENASEGLKRTLVYLNRLSDYLFVAARHANFEQGVRDVPWIPGEDR